MKKLTLLVALIVCVTVGSVYAAWIYTGSTVSTADRTLSHGMATATTDGDIGILTVVHNDVDIKIDQTAVGNYLANLVITGSIQVRFTPNDGAPSDAVNNAIPAQMSLYAKNLDTNMYEGSPIYAIIDESVDLVWEKQADGTFLATVDAATIDGMLDLGAAFELETHAKWQTFHDLEEKITLTAQFSKK
jgi:hypothetical protein